MTLDTLLAPVAALATPDGLSSEIVRMVDRVSPSVVQVRRHNHGAGAGVIWHTNGGIITNQHVVAHHGGAIEVLFPDGRVLEAAVTNRNATLDLAMLKVEAGDLPAAPVADSSHLRVGELVFAIGHPWGQRSVVTAGIVSGLGDVPLPGGEQTAQYIRSDVRLAPGNSGGPLLNAGGAVVGINAMIFGGDLSVAIPSHVATQWVAGLPSRRVFLGVSVEAVALGPVARRGPLAGRQRGLRVIDTQPDGPAARAGLRADDVLLAADGQALEEPDALLDIMAVNTDRLRFHVLRRGAILALEVQPAPREAAG